MPPHGARHLSRPDPRRRQSLAISATFAELSAGQGLLGEWEMAVGDLPNAELPSLLADGGSGRNSAVQCGVPVPAAGRIPAVRASTTMYCDLDSACDQPGLADIVDGLQLQDCNKVKELAILFKMQGGGPTGQGSSSHSAKVQAPSNARHGLVIAADALPAARIGNAVASGKADIRQRLQEYEARVPNVRGVVPRPARSGGPIPAIAPSPASGAHNTSTASRSRLRPPSASSSGFFFSSSTTTASRQTTAGSTRTGASGGGHIAKHAAATAGAASGSDVPAGTNQQQRARQRCSRIPTPSKPAGSIALRSSGVTTQAAVPSSPVFSGADDSPSTTQLKFLEQHPELAFGGGTKMADSPNAIPPRKLTAEERHLFEWHDGL